MFLPYSTNAHNGTIRIMSLLIVFVCIGVHILVTNNLEQVTESLNSSDAISKVLDNVREEEQLQESNDLAQSQAARAEQEFAEKKQQTLMYQLGLVWSDLNPVNFLTHLFVHSDWWHLIGNLWFFYLCGVTMEKYWGSAKFFILYLLCGIIAAATFVVWAKISGANINGVPLVGASGAIAGIMGAFVYTHRNSKVKIFWFLGLRWGVFGLPSLLYFGFWIVENVYYAVVLSKASSGVAYSAHVGGFVAGLLFGALIKNENGEVQTDFVTANDAKRKREYEMIMTEAENRSRPSSLKETTSLESSKTALERLMTALSQVSQNPAVARATILAEFDKVLNTNGLTGFEVQNVVAGIFRHHDELKLGGAQYFSWARLLMTKKYRESAIACFDAAKNLSEKQSHIHLISLLNASELRADIGKEYDVAKADLQQLASLDPGGEYQERGRIVFERLNREPPQNPEIEWSTFSKN